MSRLLTKPAKWYVRPAKTQISLGIRPVWSESSLSAWRKLGSLATHWVHSEETATHWAHSEETNQTGRMPRLIWVFAGHTVILLVLSWGGSNTICNHPQTTILFAVIAPKWHYMMPLGFQMYHRISFFKLMTANQKWHYICRWIRTYFSGSLPVYCEIILHLNPILCTAG